MSLFKTAVNQGLPGNLPEGDAPQTQPPRPWRPSLMICVVLAALVLGVFGRTVRYDFVNYDDDLYIYESPVITRGLTLDGVIAEVTHHYDLVEWYPVEEISHMVDWEFYGPKPAGHHLTNVLLDAATVALLFLGLQRLTGARWRSAFVAAIFAIHPMRVESVAWVSERKDMLSGFFFVLTLWMWARYAEERAKNAAAETAGGAWIFNPGRWPGAYTLALVFFALGLMSKSSVVTLPCVLLLLDYWPLGRLAPNPVGAFGPRRWLYLILEKAPFLLLSAAACVITIRTQAAPLAVAQGLSLPWRVGNALLAHGIYLQHLVWPVGLHLLYPHPPAQLPIGAVVASGVVLLGITVAVLAKCRRHPYLLVGWLWYVGMLMPVIDTMQAGDQARADRYAYLPQIGLYIMLAWGVSELTVTLRRRELALGVGAGAVLASLLLVTWAQTGYWKNSESLWNRTLAITPESYIAHCNLGIALAAGGRTDEAIQHFDTALQLNPKDGKTLNNLGKVMTSQGKWPDATHDFQAALDLDPRDAMALNNMGVALAAQHQFQAAVGHYEKALDLQPEFAEAEYNLGNARVAEGQLDEAIHCYEQTLKLDPAHAGAQCNWGLALARQGDLDGAVQHYQEALELKPDYREALNNLGSALVAQGKLEEAAQYYEQSLRLQPANLATLDDLGVLKAKQGHTDEAVQYFEQALKLNPDDASSHNNLGIALASQHKEDEAIQQFQQALDIATARNDTKLATAVQGRLRACEAARQ